MKLYTHIKVISVYSIYLSFTLYLFLSIYLSILLYAIMIVNAIVLRAAVRRIMHRRRLLQNAKVPLPGLCERGRQISFPCTYELPPCEVFNDAAQRRHEASRRGIRSACPSANTSYARMHTRVRLFDEAQYARGRRRAMPLVSRISLRIPPPFPMIVRDQNDRAMETDRNQRAR